MYGYEDDDGGEGRSFLRIAVAIVAIAAIGGAAWFVINGRSGADDGDDADVVIPVDDSPSSVGETLESTLAPSSSAPATTAAATLAIAVDTTTVDTTTTTLDTTTSTTSATTSTTAPPTTTTTAPPRTTTTTPRRTTTTERARRQRQRQEPVTYDTLPDGTPAPAVAIFDVDQITLNGAVPDQAAKDRLQALALANAKPGQGNIVNFLTINPDVPRSVGVRVVELTSARFPTGSADVRRVHAAELNRVVSIMAALPNITALVIGHSDQRGDELGNYELSAERAEAVINYLAGHGVAPNRLSSRAVGENDLLTLNNDEAALALNRRTEFVFYGLLIE